MPVFVLARESLFGHDERNPVTEIFDGQVWVNMVDSVFGYYCCDLVMSVEMGVELVRLFPFLFGLDLSGVDGVDWQDVEIHVGVKQNVKAGY